VRAAALHQPADIHVGVAVGIVAPGQETLAQALVAGAESGVHDQQAAEPAGCSHRQGEADQSAPVLDHEHDVAQIQRLDQLQQGVAVEVERIRRLVDRLVGAAKPQEIRRNHPAGGGEGGDHAPVEVAPGRLAVQAEPDLAGTAAAGLDVVQAQAVGAREIARLVRPAGQAGEALLRRAPRRGHALMP
jgi:hypothetical protein